MKRIVVWCSTLFCCVMLLGACGATGAPSVSVNTGLMPASVPFGWHVFHGPHFALAYPDGWTVRTSAQSTDTAGRLNVGYAFDSADRKPMVSVNEQDGWDAASIEKTFCSQGQPVQMAGLTWRYVTAQNGELRAWLFVAGKGTLYGVGTQDGAQPQAVQQQNQAVLATFRAEYTTPGCK